MTDFLESLFGVKSKRRGACRGGYTKHKMPSGKRRCVKKCRSTYVRKLVTRKGQPVKRCVRKKCPHGSYRRRNSCVRKLPKGRKKPRGRPRKKCRKGMVRRKATGKCTKKKKGRKVKKCKRGTVRRTVTRAGKQVRRCAPKKCGRGRYKYRGRCVKKLKKPRKKRRKTANGDGNGNGDVPGANWRQQKAESMSEGEEDEDNPPGDIYGGDSDDDSDNDSEPEQPPKQQQSSEQDSGDDADDEFGTYYFGVPRGVSLSEQYVGNTPAIQARHYKLIPVSTRMNFYAESPLPASKIYGYSFGRDF